MALYRHTKGIVQFGNNLRKIRLQKGLSQKELAYLCDVEISQISRIERGIMSTSVSFVFVLAEKLGIQPHELFIVDA